MPKYNLDALGPQEFERLCQSLVQQVIGPGAKVYGMGKDGAREATFHGKAPYPSKEERWDGSWIFQAKFHDVQQIGPVEARRQLLADIDDELSKITKKYQHQCDNFILMTNVTLTPAYQTGTRDLLDKKIIPKYHRKIKNIHVWGADEICRFLDTNPGIRQTYADLLVSGDIIARLLGMLEQKEADLDELVKLYCQGCLKHEKFAVLDDAGDIEEKRIELPSVFVDLDVTPPVLPKNTQILEKLPGWLKQATESENRKSALSYLLDDSIPGLVLIGGPGAGKSTLGQYLAHIYRLRLLRQLSEIRDEVESLESCILRIPFRIVLREYAQWITAQKNSDGLATYLFTQVSRVSERNVTTEGIDKIFKSNPSILILDGLDEIAEKKLRTKVLDNITSFINRVRDVLGGNIRIIATTRPYGYSEEFDPIHYLHLTLKNLSPEKALIYTDRWTKAREPIPEESARIKTTFNTCLKDRVASVLTTTLLQVTILLVIIRAKGTPPKQREELFEEYMNIIYERDQKRRPELLRTEKNMMYGLHKYLAYLLHKRAEKDETAALMNIDEFKEKVLEYLIFCDPTLNEEEIKDRLNQIITEASQRLVLIESPQEGKIGFGLTTIREFFAAAHLVDTAKSTQERDEKFKAIARLPHWRNVALFFAGRVGRNHSGEAPSLIDVCRSIDTERADKFLKRGAELTLEIVDDKALREPHNEVGAIQYSLSLLDADFVKNREELLKKIKSLPERYKERIILPWLEERLNKVVPSSLELYADVYHELFDVQETLVSAIKRGSESDLKEVKLWALREAIQSKVNEKWVVELMEELVNIFSVKKMARRLSDHLSNLPFYLRYPISSNVKLAIFSAFLLGPRRGFSHEDIKRFSDIRLEGKYDKNLLPLRGIIQLLAMTHIMERYERRDWSVLSRWLPAMANPKVRAMVSENASLMKEFCETFSKEKEPLIRCLVALFEYLMGPHNLEKYINLYEVSQDISKIDPLYQNLIMSIKEIIGIPSQDREKLYKMHKELVVLCKHYKSEKQYEMDMKELNDLINEENQIVPNHSQRLFIWIQNECDSSLERFLDSKILGKIKKWLQARGLSENAFCMRWWRVNIPHDLEFLKFTIELVKRYLLEGQKPQRIEPIIPYYDWHEPKTKQESEFANQIKNILEEVLAKYQTLDETECHQLEILYWVALSADVIEEKHMLKLTKLWHKQAFLLRDWYYEQKAVRAQQTLMVMLKSENSEVARLAGVSLSIILRGRFFREERKGIKESWVGDKYWEFAQDKNDIWRPRYIQGMVYCQLKWAEKGREWLEAIKKADTEELQYAWCQVIEETDYCDIKDRDTLFELLLQILEDGEAFAKPIRTATLRRLHNIVREVEPVGFEEKPLNLPLPQRGSIF